MRAAEARVPRLGAADLLDDETLGAGIVHAIVEAGRDEQAFPLVQAIASVPDEHFRLSCGDRQYVLGSDMAMRRDARAGLEAKELDLQKSAAASVRYEKLSALKRAWVSGLITASSGA